MNLSFLKVSLLALLYVLFSIFTFAFIPRGIGLMGIVFLLDYIALFMMSLSLLIILRMIGAQGVVILKRNLFVLVLLHLIATSLMLIFREPHQPYNESFSIVAWFSYHTLLLYSGFFLSSMYYESRSLKNGNTPLKELFALLFVFILGFCYFIVRIDAFGLML